MLSDQDRQLVVIIFELIKQSTSQKIVKDFLESKGIPKTFANWDDLYLRRLVPALEEGKIQVHDLRQLLQRVEEHGKQHIFLYKCDADRAASMLSEQRISKIAKESGIDALLSQPKDLYLPDSPEVVDIRLKKIYEPKAGMSLTIKVVETRYIRSLVSDTTNISAGEAIKRYSIEKKRAVNIARLHENGLLELRIASRDNTKKYIEDVNTLFSKIRLFIPRLEFNNVSLSTVKDKLVKNKDSLVDVRYSHSSAKNDYGCVMQIATSSQEDNLTTDTGSMAAMDSFLEEDGFVTGANVYLMIPNSSPKREIHVLLSGENNEFAIPISCTPEDYDYVLGKVITLNQEVSAGGASTGQDSSTFLKVVSA